MVEEPLAGLGACAGDEVQHALREHVLNETDQFKYGEGGVGRGLQHDGVACGESRSEFPRRHEEGEIPRDDLADDADRFVEHEGERIVVEHGRGAFVGADAACEVAEMIRRHGDVHRGGLADGLAVVHRFHESEMRRVLIDDVGDLEEEILTFDGAGLAEAFQRSVRRLHCRVHIFLRRFRAFREELARRRIVRFKDRAVRCGHPCAVDKEAVLFLKFCFCHVVTSFRKKREANKYILNKEKWFAYLHDLIIS